MHIEKNIAENILKTLFDEKDIAKVRLDMQERNIQRHMWLRREDEDGNRAYMPDANYVLSKQEREKFLKCLKAMKMPSHLCRSLHSRISKGKL